MTERIYVRDNTLYRSLSELVDIKRVDKGQSDVRLVNSGHSMEFDVTVKRYHPSKRWYCDAAFDPTNGFTEAEARRDSMNRLRLSDYGIEVYYKGG